MLEEILIIVRAAKIETVEGIIIAHGQFDNHMSIEETTPENLLPKLEPRQKEAYGFFYVVKSDNGLVGVELDVRLDGQYPGNGAKAKFKLYRNGWLIRNSTSQHKLYLPAEAGIEEQTIEFYRGAIDPALIKQTK